MEIVISVDLDVHYGFVHLLSGGLQAGVRDSRGGQVNGLCGAGKPGVLEMITGLHTGSVPFTLSITDQEPALGEEWEDVVEVSFEPRGPDCWLATFHDGVEFLLPTVTSYRARYCAIGMDEADNGGVRTADEPVVDRYLLQLWPAPMSGDAVVREASQVAAYWHGEARSTPPPPPPPTPQERAAAAARKAAKRARKNAAGVLLVERDAWGGTQPGDALRSGGYSAQRLANTHRRLADQLAGLDPGSLRRVAYWLASTACARAGTTALDWAPALDALRHGDALPSPFNDPEEAWMRLYGPLQLVAEVVAGDAPVAIHPPAAALATVLVAAHSHPTVAAFDAIEQAASAYADPEELLAALRHEFGLN